MNVKDLMEQMVELRPLRFFSYDQSVIAKNRTEIR